MKNLKKIAALVIVLAMALSSVAFASFTDVTDEASYNEAVTVMSALGLLKGYEDGTFGPDKTITRAEFAAVIDRALGMEEQAAGAAANTIFTDVPSTHWASGYVQIANQQGIIAGYGDGTFGPDDEVTYEQAVKMIICALGFAPKFANVADAYPTSYLAQANTSGVTVGAAGKIGDKATRATVARLVYNALDVGMMEQTKFGNDPEFSVPDNYKTLLSNNLKVAKVDASVVSQYFNKDESDKVKINISDVDDVYYRADNEMTVGDHDFYYADGVNLQKGYTCVAYIDFNDDDKVIKAMVPKGSKNKTVVVTDTQAKDGYIDFSAHKAGYYKTDSDTDSDTTDIKLEDDVEVYVNKNASSESDTATVAANFKKGDYKEITFIDNDNNSKYDYIYVTEYSSMVVGTINSRSYKISADYKNGKFSNITLDPEDDNKTFLIKDTAGNTVAFSDIKEGDVLNIFESVDGSDTYDEVIVSNGKVEGTISEYNSSTDKYTIGDKEYTSATKSFAAGDAGIFTVDMYDVILKYDLDGGNRKFGLAYKAWVDDDGVDNIAKIMMYTSDGKYETYEFAKNVKMYNLTSDEAATVKDSDLKSGSAINKTYLKDANAEIAMYVVNSSNQVTELYYQDYIAKKDSEYKVADTSASEVSYKESSDKIGSYYLTDSTKLIANDNDTMANTDKADYSATTKSVFVDDDGDTTYSIRGIYDSNKNLVFAVVCGASPKADKASSAMYVTSVGSTTDSEGSSADSVTGYVAGEKVVLTVVSDAKYYNIDGTDATGSVSKGDVIQYVKADEVESIRFIVKAADYSDYIDGTAKKVGDKESAKDNGFLTYGTINEYKNSTATFDVIGDISFKSAVEGMMVRFSDASNGTISKVYTSNISIDMAETEEDNVTDNDDIVIVYKYDDEEIATVILDVDGDTKI